MVDEDVIRPAAIVFVKGGERPTKDNLSPSRPLSVVRSLTS